MFEPLSDGSYGIIENDDLLFCPAWEMDARLHVTIKNRVLLKFAKWLFGNRYEYRGVSLNSYFVTSELGHKFTRTPNDQSSATPGQKTWDVVGVLGKGRAHPGVGCSDLLGVVITLAAVSASNSLRPECKQGELSPCRARSRC